MRIKTNTTWMVGLLFSLFTGLASAANALIVHDGSGFSADVVANLSAKLVANGDTVTTNVDVPAGSLSGYAQVWDVRYNTALTAGDQSSYLTYLQSGGALFVMGENTGFPARNTSVVALVSGTGGGAIVVADPNSQTQTVQAPFTGPNTVTSITYLASAASATLGNGASITNDGTHSSAIVWGPGSLSNAPTGSLIVVFDVNFLQTSADANSQLFSSNLVAYLANPVPVSPPTPTSIPTLSEWGMIMLSSLLALVTILTLRRQRQ